MLTVLEAANHLITLHEARGGLRPLRLHHLLYCAHGLAMVTEGKPELSLPELPRAYGFGPIYESLHTRLRHTPLSDYLTSPMRKRFSSRMPMPDPAVDGRAIRHLSVVRAKFAHFSDNELSAYCRQPEGAWDVTPLRQAISPELMAHEFEGLLAAGRKQLTR